jgi:cell division protein ZapA
MSTSENGVCVRILEKEFRIACPSNQEQALRESAHYLDQQMRKIRQTGKVIGLERIAMMAALNITNAYLSLKNSPSELEAQFSERLRVLQDKIDGVLAQKDETKERTDAVVVQAEATSEHETV